MLKPTRRVALTLGRLGTSNKMHTCIFAKDLGVMRAEAVVRQRRVVRRGHPMHPEP